ncbi:hypothetical protein ACVWYG_000626 [Pedobacter sp. UYEF25]
MGKSIRPKLSIHNIDIFPYLLTDRETINHLKEDCLAKIIVK